MAKAMASEECHQKLHPAQSGRGGRAGGRPPRSAPAAAEFAAAAGAVAGRSPVPGAVVRHFAAVGAALSGRRPAGRWAGLAAPSSSGRAGAGLARRGWLELTQSRGAVGARVRRPAAVASRTRWAPGPEVRGRLRSWSSENGRKTRKMALTARKRMGSVERTRL
ncbi:translation initiation factor IF-2-like [Herpailurus yagouaroundi]|uniref:translation initiation factor IF-2-like n=1 Tax=Herpailurus yagouaroundi TaxID=1608482 RepID=UPI001AD63072|nr:translation initiation factor IF-2-like [Puma yagouaroundi]